MERTVSNVETAFSRTIKQLIGLMLVMIAAAVIAGFYLKGMIFSVAVLYGGAITVASSLFFAWRLRVATQEADNSRPDTGVNKAGTSASVNAAVLFQGIILRLVIVIVLLAVGMAVLKLDPLGILIGFGVPLTAYWFSGQSYGVTRRK